MSLRFVLLATILAATLAAWGVAGVVSYRDTRAEIDALFDAHLAESARAILWQADHERREGKLGDQGDESDGDAEEDEEAWSEINRVALRDRGTHFAKRLVFQIWDASGRLVMGSRKDLREDPLMAKGQEGFADVRVGHHEMRAFSAWSPKRDLNVQVAESLSARRSLVKAAVANILTPMAVMIVPLLLALAFVIDRALKPVRALSGEVARRTPEDLSPLAPGPLPRELGPMVSALNGLLARLSRALANEQRFTADAAHELRTPLAAIKVQAQVAAREADEGLRRRALDGVAAGVDRASHVVDQLLAMARLDPETESGGEAIGLRDVTLAVVSRLAPAAVAQSLDLAVEDGDERQVRGNRAMLEMLVRNLVDNAIRYTPAGGRVRVTVGKDGDGAALVVADDGPGLSEAQMRQATGRFTRLSRPSGEGSGLGLSIVDRIARLHGATLSLGRGAQGKGLIARVAFPGMDRATRGGESRT